MINKRDVLNLIKELESRVSEDLHREADETVLDILLNKIEGMEDVADTNAGGKWIPCSERLPQRQDGENTFLQMYLVQSKRGVIHMGFRDEDGIWRTIHGNRVYGEVAWMPLPEPYREVES